MYNWKINITTRSRTWERSMNLDDLVLEMFGKRIVRGLSELLEFMFP